MIFDDNLNPIVLNVFLLVQFLLIVHLMFDYLNKNKKNFIELKIKY